MEVRILTLFLILFAHLQARVSYTICLTDAFTLEDQRQFYAGSCSDFALIDSFYKFNNYQALFNPYTSTQLKDKMNEVAYWGLNMEKYNKPIIDSLFQNYDAKAHAYFEIMACQAFLKLYGDILNGKIQTEKERGENIHLKLSTYSKWDLLQRLKETKSVQALTLAEPNTPAYTALKEMLQFYINNKDTLAFKPVVFIDSLHYGQRDSSVVLLRQKLFFLGDLKKKQRLNSTYFDKDVEKALLNFQQRNLLDTTKLLDKETIEQLNKAIEPQIKEMQLTLERWRWLPQFLGSYYAFANLPAFEMSLVKNDTLILRQNIVCGKIGRNTPVFSDTMVYIDFNPTWTVPPTILQKDILPAVRRSSSYLKSKNIKVLNVATGKYVNASSINWANAKNYKFIQGPGLNNSLGVVKFIFPNDYYIFFHDTPHKEHFPLKVRAYSSGCVRLSQPVHFAEVLLQFNNEPYSSAKIDTILKSEKTTRVLLDEKPFVYINYLTYEMKDGLLFHYPDIYKYNGKLEDFFFKSE